MALAWPCGLPSWRLLMPTCRRYDDHDPGRRRQTVGLQRQAGVSLFCRYQARRQDGATTILTRGGVNTLSVACYPALGLGFMPRVLARLARERPDPATRPQVSLQILSSREVRDRVQSAQADFGLMADEMPTAGLEHSVFARFNGVVVMHPSHRFAKLASIQLNQLDNEPFLALNPEDSTRIRLEQELKSRGIRPNVQVESPYSISVCQMAMLGLGIGIANPAAALEFADTGLAIRPLELDIPFTSLLIMSPGRPLSRLAQLFLALMRAQLADDELQLKKLLEPSSVTPSSRRKTSAGPR